MEEHPPFGRCFLLVKKYTKGAVLADVCEEMTAKVIEFFEK
jgi:hypothetical protein